MQHLQVLIRPDVESLMQYALNGGSNYWYKIRTVEKDKVYDATPELNDQAFSTRLVAAVDKGVEIAIHDQKWVVIGRLNRESWAKAEEVMKTKYHRHFAQVLAENFRSMQTASDIFFQLAVAGKLIHAERV